MTRPRDLVHVDVIRSSSLLKARTKTIQQTPRRLPSQLNFPQLRSIVTATNDIRRPTTAMKEIARVICDFADQDTVPVKLCFHRDFSIVFPGHGVVQSDRGVWPDSAL